RPFTPTVPEPMAFEERAAARPKPIRTVKLEQDLAIKQQEEQAARHWRHKARPCQVDDDPGTGSSLLTW
ncbi:predicted protein, partial [Haematococcus lacustris]